jgi:23S rRNA G2445 N2-methylase RlmL
VPAGLARGENPQQFSGIQPMAAHDGAIQEQHRDIQSIAALQFRVGIDIHHLQGRQWRFTSQPGELRHHLVAQLAVLTMHEGEAHPYFGPWAGSAAADRFINASMMKRTVAGGTSPRATNLCPDCTEVKADEVPTCARPAPT